MDIKAFFADFSQRPVDAATTVLAGISVETLHAQPGGAGNSIAWLMWHAARQLDYQLAELTGTEQVWTVGNWGERLGVDRGANTMGFGDSPADVAALRVGDAAALGEYLAAAVAALNDYIATLSEADFDEIIDTSWDPPVSRGVRLVSIIDDAITHLGQAAYARGLVDSWSIGY